MGQTPSKKSRKGKDKSKDDSDKDAENHNDPSDADATASAEDHDGGNGAQRRATAPNTEPEYASAATRGASALTEHAEDGTILPVVSGDGITPTNVAGLHPPSCVCFPRFFGRSLTKHAFTSFLANDSKAGLTPAPIDIPSANSMLLNPNALSPGAVAESLTPMESATSVTNGNAGKDKDKMKQQQSFDVDDMIQRLLDVGYTGKVSKSLCLKGTEITAVCIAARDIFLSQPTLVELSPPVKIVGDVHGQYSDLIRLFEMCGFPPSANYLFLGDYVDRGKQSLETILLLLCYKIKYPENFFLLRGNHECANVTRGSYLIFPGHID